MKQRFLISNFDDRQAGTLQLTIHGMNLAQVGLKISYGDLGSRGKILVEEKCPDQNGAAVFKASVPRGLFDHLRNGESVKRVEGTDVFVLPDKNWIG